MLWNLYNSIDGHNTLERKQLNRSNNELKNAIISLTDKIKLALAHSYGAQIYMYEKERAREREILPRFRTED